MVTRPWLRNALLLVLVPFGAAPEAAVIDLESVARRLLAHLGAKETACPPETESLALTRFLVCGELQVHPLNTAKEIDLALFRRKAIGVRARPATNWSKAGHSRSREYALEGAVFGVKYDWSSSVIVVSYLRPFRPCEASRTEIQAAVDACTGTQPKKVARKFAQYPESARIGKINGQVEVAAIIDVNGLIRDACVLKGTGDGRYGFEEATIEALGTWRYTPAMQDGKPVECTIIIITDFIVR